MPYSNMNRSILSANFCLVLLTACHSGSTPLPADPAEALDVNVDFTELVEGLLRTELNASVAASGSIAILDVASGRPLAIRGFQRTEEGDLHVADELVNAIGVEHGSIMMLPVLMKGIEDRRLRLEQRFDRSGGEYEFKGVLMRDPPSVHADSLTLAEAFVQRSNVVVAKAMTQAYPSDGERVFAQLRAADLVQADLQDTDRLPWVSIGYEARQTPLQLVQWYSQVANAQLDGTHATTELHVAHDLLVRSAAYLHGNGLLDTIPELAGQMGLIQSRGSDGRQKYRTVFVGYYPAAVPRYVFLICTERPAPAGYANAEVTMRILQRLIAAFAEH